MYFSRHPGPTSRWQHSSWAEHCWLPGSTPASSSRAESTVPFPPTDLDQKALHKPENLPTFPQNVLGTQEDLGRPHQRAPPCDVSIGTFQPSWHSRALSPCPVDWAVTGTEALELPSHWARSGPAGIFNLVVYSQGSTAVRAEQSKMYWELWCKHAQLVRSVGLISSYSMLALLLSELLCRVTWVSLQCLPHVWGSWRVY